MVNKRNFRMILIGVGFLMASIVAPIVVVIFETHYQQWLDEKSPQPENVPLPEQNKVSSLQPKLVLPSESNQVSSLQPETRKGSKPETTPLPKINQASIPNNDVSTSKKPDDKPLTVKLWLDSPTKTQFYVGDKVTFYYQIISKNNVSTTAYLTLFYKLSVKKWRIVINNDVIKTGKIYSLPRKQAVSQPGKNVNTNTRFRLPAGQQHVIAIVTPTPIKWEDLGADIITGLQRITIWGIKELIIDVK